jgi:hypothetical protein
VAGSGGIGIAVCVAVLVAVVVAVDVSVAVGVIVGVSVTVDVAVTVNVGVLGASSASCGRLFKGYKQTAAENTPILIPSNAYL